MKVKSLLCALLMVVAVGWSAAPAEAATYNSYFSELSTPAKANINNQVTLSGRIQPTATSRPVSLYIDVAPDGSGGTWIMGANTDANGRFSFTTSVYSARRFKFFAAKQVVGNNTYQPQSTSPFVVSPPDPVTLASSYSELSFPSQTSLNGTVTVSGRIWPAAAGRAVSLYDGVNVDGSGGTWKAGTSTDANGRFSFVTSVSGTTRFKFYSGPQTNGNYIYDYAGTGAYSVTADFASSYSELSFPAQTNLDGTVTLSGRIWPAAAGRAVSLYDGVNPDGSGGTFKAGTTTDANGRFSFVTSVNGTTQFKFYSGPQTNGTALYNYAGSGASIPVTSEFVSSFTGVEELTPVVYTDLNGQFAITGRLWPVAPSGRLVSIYKDADNNPDTDNSEYVGAVTTGSDGWFTVNLGVPTVMTYNLYAGPQTVGTAHYAYEKGVRFRVRALQLFDDFSYGGVSSMVGANAPWQIRQPGYQPDTPNDPDDDPRTENRGGAEALALVPANDPETPQSDQALKMTVLWDGIDPVTQVDNTNKFVSGFITRPLEIKYGHFEARVKFDIDQGAVAGFWHQQLHLGEVGYHEFDVVESWGKGGPVWDPAHPTPWLSEPHVQYTVHRNEDGTKWPTRSPQVVDSWWDQYHTVKGEWLQGTGYQVKIDDGPWTPIDTAGFIGSQSAGGELILSLLVDNKHAEWLRLHHPKGTDLGLAYYVNWVRVWR